MKRGPRLASPNTPVSPSWKSGTGRAFSPWTLLTVAAAHMSTIKSTSHHLPKVCNVSQKTAGKELGISSPVKHPGATFISLGDIILRQESGAAGG